MRKIAIYGAGGFGREVACLIEDINKLDHRWDIIGFFDDAIQAGSVADYKILGGINELNDIKEKIYLAVAIGWPDSKKKLIKKITNSLIDFPIIIHPSVIMSEQVEIGKGSIICAGTIATVNVKIGKYVIVNLDCTIGHDAVLKDYCSLMPSVNISGETEIGEGSFFGTNTLIINRRRVGANSIIGAGAVVIDDIPENCTAVGNPAKIVKNNINNGE
jgi:sugar O-acyltransferase (sialic acid O-acetyltransferase NeuD family)